MLLIRLRQTINRLLLKLKYDLEYWEKLSLKLMELVKSFSFKTLFKPIDH